MKQVNCTNESFFEYPNDKFELRNTFIGICNEVLPDKIEQLYVQLINHLVKLESLFNTIRSNDSNITKNGKTLQGFKLEKPNSLQQIQAYLSTKSGDLSKDDLQGLATLVGNLQEQRKSYDIQQRHANELNNQNVERASESFDVQQQIKQEINSIISSYLNLQNLDMGNRLNGITVSQKHVDEIKNIPNLGDKEKAALIRHLNDHTLLRTETFKCAESYADNIANSYANNSLSTNLNDLKPENWDLLSESIKFDSEVFANNTILDADELKFLDNKDKINALYEAVINTVNGEKIEKKDVIYLESLPHPVVGESQGLYCSILDNVKNKQGLVQQNNMEHSSVRS